MRELCLYLDEKTIILISLLFDKFSFVLDKARIGAVNNGNRYKYA